MLCFFDLDLNYVLDPSRGVGLPRLLSAQSGITCRHIDAAFGGWSCDSGRNLNVSLALELGTSMLQDSGTALG
jgi:hypothetical protein